MKAAGKVPPFNTEVMMMELDVSQGFLHPATPYPFQASLMLAPQDVGGETVTFAPVMLEGTYFVADDTVRLEGRLTTTARANCALCLGLAEKAVEVTFDETFRKDANETEDECFSYEGKVVPLDHMALTLVMLNLPMRFVCGRPDCHADVALKAWNEEEKTWAENDGETATYRPFEGLDVLLDEEKREH